MTLTFWPGFPLWRELYHPIQRRWWRCRPTARGVELGFRDDEETEWGSRVVHKSLPAPESWSSVMVREAAEAQAVVHARRLLDEQLADGFVERSRAPGIQLWEQLPALWRAQSPAFDPEPLVQAQASREAPALSEVTTWLAFAGASTSRPRSSGGRRSSVRPSRPPRARSCSSTQTVFCPRWCSLSATTEERHHRRARRPRRRACV